MNLSVIDHLIINQESFFSFALTGLLSKLERSKKYAVYFIEEEKLLKRGQQEKALEVAQALKQRNVDIHLIAETTGLSLQEIEQL